MFEYIAKIFKAPPKPVPLYHDDIFGDLIFNNDDESWECQYKGIRVLFSYECESTPRNDQRMYGLQILGDFDEYKTAIEKAKELYVSENAEYADEVNKLKVEEISFNMHKGKPWFMVSLGTGNDFREWRTEFHGMSQECKIAFDS